MVFLTFKILWFYALFGSNALQHFRIAQLIYKQDEYIYMFLSKRFHRQQAMFWVC